MNFGTQQSQTVLQDFIIIRPEYELAQADTLRWLGNVHAQVEARQKQEDSVRSEFFIRLFQRFGCSPNRIGKRGTELSDSLTTDLAQMEIFSPAPHPSDHQADHQADHQPSHRAEIVRGISGVGFSTRAQFFDRVTQKRVEQLFERDTTPPQQLIHVTCTGYSSPSSIQTLVSKRGWTQQSSVTHAYHMGCYASLPAIRIADGFRATGVQRTDIVHTELCSLHLNLADHSPEQMVVQSLFADGYIRYSVVNSENAGAGGLELIAISEEILPDSTELMSWKTSEWGMRMTLSKDVPKRLSLSIGQFVERMLASVQCGEPEFLSDMIFAIHPGGPRIIDQLQAELKLREEQVSHSKKILFNYGNMSSATLPHIWHSIVEDSDIPAGKWILSLAFGPGLTAFGALMRKR